MIKYQNHGNLPNQGCVRLTDPEGKESLMEGNYSSEQGAGTGC